MNDLNNPFFLIAGYGITFIAVLAYLLRIRAREREFRGDSAREG